MKTPIFSRSDSIALRRTTLHSTPCSQFIPSHTLLAWIHTMPHQQRSPQIIRTQWGQCDFSPGQSSGTPTEKLLKLSSYVHILCLNNMANTHISLNFHIQLASPQRHLFNRTHNVYFLPVVSLGSGLPCQLTGVRNKSF